MARSRKITYVFGADISELERGWKRIDSRLRGLSKNIERHGQTMTKAFTVPLAAIGGVATKAALDTEKAVQAIARGTGAQGDALKNLEKEWKKLAVSVTQGFEESAQVLADYNTRLGLTGKSLGDISKQALDAARMVGENVNAVVAESAKAMQSWSVEAENMSGFMDKLFKASQSTGVGIARLSGQLYRYGASLRGMGFDLESSVALLAQFERQGVNVERIMSSLSQGLGRMARAGVTDANEAFQKLIREIEEAENSTEATRIAVEIFGRSGADMAMAIHEGRFEVADLIDVLREAEGAIQKAADETETFGDKMSKLSKTVGLALEPIGREILSIAEEAMPRLQDASESIANSISEMSDSSRRKIVELAGALTLGGPLLFAISAAINAIRNIGSLVLAIFVSPAGPWVLAIASVYAMITALKNYDKVRQDISDITPMERAAEIGAGRYNKYWVSPKEQEKLEESVKEVSVPSVVIPEPEPVKIPDIEAPPAFGVPDVEESFRAASAAAEAAARERVRQIGEVTAAQIEQIDRVKQKQLEAQEAAARGVAKFWQDMAWEYNQGLLDAQTYFDMLKNELGNVEQGSEEWKRTFEDIQRVASDIVNTNIEVLTEKLRDGKITTDEFSDSVAQLREQFQDLPLAVETLDSSLKRVGEESKNMIDFASDLGMTFQSAFENAIIEGENFRSVLSGLFEDISRIILRMYVVNPLANSVMGFMTSAFGLPAIKMHSGGVVGLAGTPITVPIDTFAGAPRLHNGLGPDEFPAILQRGETVIPRNETVEAAEPSVKIVNVLDPSIVGNYLNTAEGERVVVNIMQKNIRRVV